MSVNFQIALTLFLLSALHLTGATSEATPSTATDAVPKSETDLDVAEANGKLEIIKQIKKVNDDGSYTIGYEADDGSFKIESRDVLGNIKGTYGYIDDNGDIKRVSYSSTNASETTVTSTNEPLTVVQRIPSSKDHNRTAPTTRRPTSSMPSANSSGVVQSIPRRRVTTTTMAPTTSPKYTQFINDALAASKMQQSTQVSPTTALYETSTPVRLLAQSKPLLRGTYTADKEAIVSEGQLSRPEVLLKPTDMPLYRRLPIKTTLLDEDTKPVTEEPEVRSNVLRRQLPPPEDGKGFDARQHVINVQQAAGEDAVDVYTASITTGTPRPLFTTLRPRLLTSTVTPQILRPTPAVIRYPAYQRPPITRTPAATTEYTQETSTEPTVSPSPVPVVQIPSSNPEEPQRQQYVELRHPFHRGAILVPVRRLPTEEVEYQTAVTEPAAEEQVFDYHRVPKFRPIPVHVDEHGFIREYSTPQPYALPTRPITLQPLQQAPYISQNDIINEVDNIKPPVSTRDFQKLLEQLILRQSRLEKISALTRNAEYYRGRAQYTEYANAPQQRNLPVQFVPRSQSAQQQQQLPVVVRPSSQSYNQYAPVTFGSSSNGNYNPSKRMARLNQLQVHPHSQHLQQEQSEDEYLPPPVREMLLLRMLQLAINPSLPLELVDNVESATTPHPRKEAVRNVEILGEDEDGKQSSRTKRYKQFEFDYYDQ